MKELWWHRGVYRIWNQGILGSTTGDTNRFIFVADHTVKGESGSSVS